MGVVNPQVEMKMTVARRNNATSSHAHQPVDCNHRATLNSSTLSLHEDFDEELQHHNVFDYGQWFIWCQNCKHGGHASCIDSWFSLHEICGVNGCECGCRKHHDKNGELVSS